VDELRPGNFVFHDLTQVRLGACRHRNIAVCLACPVVSVHHRANRAVVHGGAVHLSKDGLRHPVHGTIYGQMAFPDGRGFGEPADAYITELTQEHGVLTGHPGVIGKLKPGMIVAVYPVHSCLAAEAMAGYLTLDGRRLDHARAARMANGRSLDTAIDNRRNQKEGEGYDEPAVDAGRRAGGALNASCLGG
jgi:D-serine deaminase-like pyridoxal phosphate-dependent protein